jgi:hypothetical protein
MTNYAPQDANSLGPLAAGILNRDRDRDRDRTGTLSSESDQARFGPHASDQTDSESMKLDKSRSPASPNRWDRPPAAAELTERNILKLELEWGT